ncbi:MAG: hypothetical protein II992_05440 [Lachnospiraceae bacterium]|nr:hypothetical protein [Lachnospiraceae bacterium]
MKKNRENIFSKSLVILAICSAFIALVEGIFYYDAQEYPNAVFRFMLILQNCIQAFEFKADIGLEDIAQIINESNSIGKNVVGYAYAIILFVAPYCTLLLAYKVVARICKIRTWRFFPSNDRRIVIFGYNKDVKALLQRESSSDNKKEKRRIHLVATNVSESDEIALIKNRVILHKIDCLAMSNEELVHVAKKLELEKAKDIILFEKSSARNFSLYNMFHSVGDEVKLCNPEAKFFCRCEDDGIKRIIEDYYDTRIRDKKAEKDEEKKKQIKVFKDLEIVSIPELRIRKMLKEYPLHSYHLKRGTKNICDWNLHLLIVGFGKLGQELLLQAMNQGVVSSKNSILIDVVDSNIDEKRSIFANNFDDSYVEMNENEFVIPSEEDENARADGKFKIRFHKMDIRYKQFYQNLVENGRTENGGQYTYIAICVSDADVSLHCMSEVNRYLRTENGDKDVSLGIRIETDRQMACYLNTNENTYNNVFAIEEKECTITMDDLLQDGLDAEAKEYNRIYNTISIMTDKEYESVKNTSSTKETNSQSTKDTKSVNDYWRELELFRRNANRALANHAVIKEDIFENMPKEDLDEVLGNNGNLMKNIGDIWVMVGGVENFVKNQSNSEKHPCISELSKLEHRRWCYFMASCGWKCTEDPKRKKDDIRKENPCMCTWDDLVKYNPHMCCYDLMPLLLQYMKSKNQK